MRLFVSFPPSGVPLAECSEAFPPFISREANSTPPHSEQNKAPPIIADHSEVPLLVIPSKAKPLLVIPTVQAVSQLHYNPAIS